MYKNWIKAKVSTTYLVLLFTFALIGIILIENNKKLETYSAFEQQILAAQIMKQSFEEIKQYRVSLDILIREELDPNRTGIIGEEFTDITTTIGNIEAKRTSTNYDFAALLVRYLTELDLKKGDVIAIGASGSFPSLVMATLSAARAMDLKPLLIYSIGSSMYGANIPGFTFIQMLDILNQKNILPYKITAISLGGDNDRADGLFLSKSKDSFFQIATSANIPFIYEENIETNLEKRSSFYHDEAGEKHIKCFVNIGGASINHGHIAASINFPNGLVTKYQNASDLASSGMIFKFLAEGIPVIHLLNIKDLAIKNDIAIDPVPIPEIGKGGVYYLIDYNKSLIITVLLLIFIGFLALLLKRIGGFICK